jgi:hypothetical protein
LSSSTLFSLILLAVRYPSNLVGIFLLLVGLAEPVEVRYLGAGAFGGAVAAAGLALALPLGAGAVAVVDELAVVVPAGLGADAVAPGLGVDAVAAGLGADAVAAGLGADAVATGLGADAVATGLGAGEAGEDADTLSSDNLLPYRQNTNCCIRKRKSKVT